MFFSKCMVSVKLEYSAPKCFLQKTVVYSYSTGLCRVKVDQVVLKCFEGQLVPAPVIKAAAGLVGRRSSSGLRNDDDHDDDGDDHDSCDD